MIVSRNAPQHVGAKSMILRRFMKHVGSQNWFAVGLDVLVVIFGVYIGIYLGGVGKRTRNQNRRAGYA